MAAFRNELVHLLESFEALPVEQRLDRFIDLTIQSATSGDEWCVAGMLARDYEILGTTLQSKVRGLF